MITTTDYNPLQTETFTIQSIIDSNSINLSGPLKFPHFGQITNGVDERAEVALLTRNILIQGTKEGALGGHLVMLKVYFKIG